MTGQGGGVIALIALATFGVAGLSVAILGRKDQT